VSIILTTGFFPYQVMDQTPEGRLPTQCEFCGQKRRVPGCRVRLSGTVGSFVYYLRWDAESAHDCTDEHHRDAEESGVEGCNFVRVAESVDPPCGACAEVLFHCSNRECILHIFKEDDNFENF